MLYAMCFDRVRAKQDSAVDLCIFSWTLFGSMTFPPPRPPPPPRPAAAVRVLPDLWTIT